MLEWRFPASIYLLKVSNRNTITRCEIRRSGIFIVNFEHIFTLCSSVSIVNFEHVIAGWVKKWTFLLLIYHCNVYLDGFYDLFIPFWSCFAAFIKRVSFTQNIGKVKESCKKLKTCFFHYSVESLKIFSMVSRRFLS